MELFYYIRDKRNRPVITICLKENGEGFVFTRGIAICSLMDNPSKKLGRAIASGRATKALGNKEGTQFYPIISRKADRAIWFQLGHEYCFPFYYKSEVVSSENLTSFERKLLGIVSCAG